MKKWPADKAPLHVQEGVASIWWRWFAWRPVRISAQLYEPEGFAYSLTGEWAWLRWVERRRFYAAPWFVITGWTEYRLVEKA